MLSPEAKLYVWNWVGGGYNSAMAMSLEEARAIATKMGEPSGARTVILTPVGIRLAKEGEIQALDRAYSLD